MSKKQWVLAVPLLACIGFLYQVIGTKLDEARYPPPGELVDIGGYRIHLYNTGTGGPTVILDAGLGGISSSWGLVQPEISKFTRVVSYDRAGTGWSDESPYPRTSEQMVQELHTLLHAAKIPGPYIFVGHSLGGVNAQLFAATFPAEVLGLVLVDSGHEAQERRLPPIPIGGCMKFLQKPTVIQMASTLGILRLFSNLYMQIVVPSMPQPLWNIHRVLCTTPKYWRTVFLEEGCLLLSLKQLEGVNLSTFANKPCIVITSGAPPDLSPDLEKYWQEFHAVWKDLQKELVAKFPNSRQMVAEKSDHMIPWNQPELIVQAARELGCPNEERTQSSSLEQSSN